MSDDLASTQESTVLSSRWWWFTEDHETFDWTSGDTDESMVWDVSKAKDIIFSKTRPVYLMDVRALREWIGPDKIQIDYVKMMHLKPYQLDVPVIIARYRGTDVPIDGWHRIARHLHDGINDIMVVMLDDDESEQCRKTI